MNKFILNKLAKVILYLENFKINKLLINHNKNYDFDEIISDLNTIINTNSINTIGDKLLIFEKKLFFISDNDFDYLINFYKKSLIFSFFHCDLKTKSLFLYSILIEDKLLNMQEKLFDFHKKLKKAYINCAFLMKYSNFNLEKNILLDIITDEIKNIK